MSDVELYPVSSEWTQRARMTKSGYEAARIGARETPDAFWAEQARRLDWLTPPTSIKDVSFDRDDFRIRWFGDGVLNVAWNCLDRHLATRGDETAIIWEGDEPTQSGGLTWPSSSGRPPACPASSGRWPAVIAEALPRPTHSPRG